MTKKIKFSEKKIISDSMYNFKTPAPRPCDVSLDISKAQSELSTPLLNYKDGIKRMFDSEYLSLKLQ